MILFRLSMVLLFLSSYSNAFINYNYNLNFEQGEDIPVKYWATDLKSRDIKINYSYDNKSFTEGDSSLKIDIDIKGKEEKNKIWYYYLVIPLTSNLNFDSNLSLSMDIKTNNKDIKIGFEFEYLPLKNGTHILQQNFMKNQWNSIKIDNLQKFSLEHANNFISKIYNANLNDFGRTISKILILIKGRGAQKYQINLDNLKIVGKIEKKSIFKKKCQAIRLKYLERVNKNINEKKISYKKNLRTLVKITSCPSKNYYKNKIDSLFDKIDFMLHNNKFLKTSTINKLDSYLRRLSSFDKKLAKINIYKMPSMKYFRLVGNNTPVLDKLLSYNLRMTANEYRSIAIIIEPLCFSGTLTVESTNFIGDNNSFFSKNSLDLYVAKLWYQSGLSNTYKTGKFLTQELLLKDDKLVKVDYKTKSNYLRVKYNDNNLTKYIKISNASDKFPSTDRISFNDSKIFQPFEVNALRHKLLWAIVHIPKDTKEGNYTSIFTIKDIKGKTLQKFPINIKVLPFTLDRAKLSYSIYYTGKLTKDKVLPLDSYKKTKKQQEIELRDIKEHGILYPTSYESIQNLEDTLKLRNKVGLPRDRFYTIGFNIMNSSLSNKILNYKKILNKYRYTKDALYIYAIDEASEDNLKKELPFIKIAHDHGAKVFTAGHEYTYNYLGNYLDLFNYAHGSIKKDAKEQVKKWHKSQKEIFVYASPQVGVENPEVYRRNFGCKLWEKGFDGAMNWAYQAHRGAFWNDFDEFNSYKSKYREEAFTYPTTDGIVGTIQWEGFREAITDVRYISTLENLRDKLKFQGKDISKLNSWINNINCNSDLDKLREDIIDKILEYKRMTINE